jgi:hypothetical protein
VKADYWHDILEAYNGLENEEKVLSANEIEVLTVASEIYRSKGFEYFVPQDALTAYSRYPDLEILDQITRKLIG